MKNVLGGFIILFIEFAFDDDGDFVRCAGANECIEMDRQTHRSKMHSPAEKIRFVTLPKRSIGNFRFLRVCVRIWSVLCHNSNTHVQKCCD